MRHNGGVRGVRDNEHSTRLHTLVDNQAISVPQLDTDIFHLSSSTICPHVLARSIVLLDTHTARRLTLPPSVCRHESPSDRQGTKGRHSWSQGRRLGNLSWIHGTHVSLFAHQRESD